MKIATTGGRVEGLLAMGLKEAAVGEAVNLGSGKEHRVIDMANRVNELTGQTVRKFNLTLSFYK